MRSIATAASLPKWLKDMSDETREEYFKNHPGSKYAPNQDKELKVKDKFTFNRWKKNASYTQVSDKVDDLEQEKKDLLENLDDHKQDYNDLKDQLKELRTSAQGAVLKVSKVLYSRRISKLTNRLASTQGKISKIRKRLMQIRTQKALLSKELKQRDRKDQGPT